MLERLHIENFKCLRDVTVELAEFTILVGPNDSGKSSFLQALKTLDSMVAQQNFNSRSLEGLVWRRQADQRIKWEVSGHADNHRFQYKVERPAVGGPALEDLTFDGATILSSEVRDIRGQEVVFNNIASAGGERQLQAPPNSTFLAVNSESLPYRTVAKALSSSIEYHFDVERLQRPAVPKQGDVLHANGDNLAAILDLMQNSADRKSFDGLQGSFHAAIPSLQRFILPPAPNGKGKSLEFVLANGDGPPVTIPASQVSTGALLLTAFLTIAYSCTAEVLLIEEPENGLHPSRLQFVVDHLRKICSGEVGGRKRQVIITTHSPLLLNYAKPEEVRVFVRDNETGSTVRSMNDVRDLSALRQEFSTGELWYLLEEKNLFDESRQ